LQNKANFPDDQMNVSGTITKDYENKSNWKLGKNKANTKPLKANLLDTQMNVTSVLTKDYVNELRTTNYERLSKTNPISTQKYLAYSQIATIIIEFIAGSLEFIDYKLWTNNYEPKIGDFYV
jgi:hypothetical protein